MIRFFKSLYLTPVFFIVLGALVVLFLVAQFVPQLFLVARVLLIIFGAVTLADILVLYRVRKGVFGRRETPEKLSNGDENPLSIYLENFYNFPVSVRVVDEIPFQFQRRDIWFKTTLQPGKAKVLDYSLRPTKRGEYDFGAVNVFVASPIFLVYRRLQFSENKMVPVYPSFLQMRKYELMAISHRLHEIGVKKIRKLGHSTEFEQIRDYVKGDDQRVVNWKATARKGQLMVNQYTEERSQPVYCIIDKGRVMKMPFEGLTLLDYAINATLVLSNIAIYKQDKAGVITFSEKMGALLPADRRHTQMHSIMELLYKQKTRFLESNFEVLYANLRRKVNHRSLVLLFTNFESLTALRRQLPYLRRIAKDHLLVVIFFENTELKSILTEPSKDVEAAYLKTVAEKFAYEKRQIVKELEIHGIQSILTPPANLTVNTLNKYLEIKARGMI